MNRFFETHGDYYRPPPRRAYAMIDRLEDGKIVFEAVDADWFDEQDIDAGDIKTWSELGDQAPISVVEVDADAIRGGAGNVLVDLIHIQSAKRGLQIEPGDDWYVLHLGAGDNALYYANLFGEATAVEVEDIDVLAARLRATLDQLFSLDPFIVDEEELTSSLSSLAGREPVEWVVVYDVGQGAANGLCNAQGMPLTYVDIGRGVLGNKSTFDLRLAALCFTLSPPVVLSHWDWDHWAGGMQFPKAQDQVWIVPNQKLGAVHAAFAAGLAARGNLKVWPNNLPKLNVGQVTIRKCTGNGRNHSGLAVEVEGPENDEPVLLPGDARYNVIPGTLQRRWHSVVVPHHGADMRNGQVPGSTSSSQSRSAYSCGGGNTFSHPRAITEKAHHNNGWPHASLGASIGVERRTDKLRDDAKLGHIGIGWKSRQAPVRMPCPGLCALDFDPT